VVRRPLEPRRYRSDHRRCPAGARRNRIIDDLRKRERDELIKLPKRPALQPGDQVRILQGPFAGQLGLYAGMRPHERVLVLLQLLGGQQEWSSRRAASRQRAGGPAS